MIGRTVSHYQITGELGAGGMGVVYEAVDTKLGRTVALKFLSPESTSDSEANARFIQEAKAASALDHPNVCTIYEIGETDDDRLYLVMARYEGVTLQKKIADGALATDAAVGIGQQLAEGLAAAHNQGIVHRDIKPANIFVTTTGLVKILDFGLAKLSGPSLLTRPGSTPGTIGYMSPEQARGQAVDHRTDIWSAGVVLYEMVAGKGPFDADYEQAVVYAIVNEDVPPVASICDDVPEVLDRIIGTCLSKDPDHRYQAATELVGELQDLSGGAPIGVTAGVRRTGRGPSWWRSRRLTAAAVITLLLGAGLVLKSVVGQMRREPVLEVQRIAVLPFENLGPASDLPFCEGVTDVVTARLAGIAGFGVASRQSAKRYRASDMSADRVGRELKVDYLLEGTVQRENPADASSRMRITPQLIRVVDDTHVWAKTYDLAIESAFQVQTTIAERVAFELGITLLAPASHSNPGRIWSREMYLEQARQSLETALHLKGRDRAATSMARSHFDMAVRSLIALGLLNPDHRDGDDLARAFAAIGPQLAANMSGPEIYRAYLDSRGAPEGPLLLRRGFDLEEELGLIMAEFGVDARRMPLPRSLIARVEDYIVKFTDRSRKFTEAAYRRSVEQLPMICRELKRKNLPAVLAYLPFGESGYKPDYETPAGAVGLWQLMPDTARDYGLRVEPGEMDQRRDPVRSTVAAVDHLDFLLGVFGANQFMCAIAAYNSGAGGLTRCLRSEGDWRSPWRFWDLVGGEASCLSTETANYVPGFLAAAVIMRRPDAFGLRVE